MTKDIKPAVTLVAASVIVLTATVLYLIFDTPKYNDIKEISTAVSVSSETESTANTSAVNINTADAEELTKLFGIGEKRAADIVEYREKNGRFRTVEELTNIDGISESIIKKNSDIITV
ncbi:MAG: ComEA family DNA-binding protein [Clostridia bacterium]|nr:ComEA family DNA-binding protein [Clostridia bacterium]